LKEGSKLKKKFQEKEEEGDWGKSFSVEVK